MQDKDNIIDVEDVKEVTVTEETKEKSVEENKKEDDGYEKYCFICRRPESVAGKMIELPNHINVCSDCMQKSFDAMNNGEIDLNRLMNMPGVQVFNMADFENMIPKQQKVKQKKPKEKKIFGKFRLHTRLKQVWMSMLWDRNMRRKPFR